MSESLKCLLSTTEFKQSKIWKSQCDKKGDHTIDGWKLIDTNSKKIATRTTQHIEPNLGDKCSSEILVK